MTQGQSSSQESNCQDSPRWSRLDRAQAHADFQDPFKPPLSQRQYAQQQGIPRSTLGDWLRVPTPQGVDPQLVAFFRCAAGELFLRQILLAAHLAFRQVAPAGLGPLCQFLQWSGLDRFVGGAHGTQHSLASQIEQLLLDFDKEQRPLLAQQMAPKTIALVADEHFHRRKTPCLIAAEPLSNFLLVEEYAANRDAETWSAAIEKATQAMPLKVLLLTSDRAAALIACAHNDLQAEHLPELFHGQRDLSQPLAGPLERAKQSAAKELEQAERRLEFWRQHKEKAEATPRRGRRLDYSWRIGHTEHDVQRCQAALQACERRQEQAKAAIRGIGDDYHPFEAKSGQAVSAEAMKDKLEGHIKVLEEVVEQGKLPSKAVEAVQGGRDWLVALVGVLAWFWSVARQRVEALGLSEEAQQAVYGQLLPGLYWQQAARRGRTAQDRQQKEELAGRLLKEAREGPLRQLEGVQAEEVERVAREVVGLFSRSSSCVEGRNGRLSLFQHGQTRLSQKRLSALTVVHNYLIRRDDGSSAAQRFFGQQHPDLFDWLLQRLPDLPRPAAKRPKKTPTPPILAN